MTGYTSFNPWPLTQKNLQTRGGGPAYRPVYDGLQGSKLTALMDAVLAAYDVWNKRIPTAELNRWLEAVSAAHPPPAPQGRRLRLKYMTQAKTRPPTFAIFCTRPAELPDSYLRYLEKNLRETFDLPGTPLRLRLRKGKNPYAKD